MKIIKMQGSFIKKRNRTRVYIPASLQGQKVFFGTTDDKIHYHIIHHLNHAFRMIHHMEQIPANRFYHINFWSLYHIIGGSSS